MLRTGLIGSSLAIGACSPESSMSPSHARPAFTIQDGAHSGNLHFFFLPPMVPAPKFSGTFDGTRSPVIRITEDGSLLVELGATVPPGSQQYQAEWHTDRFNLDPAKTYRISVLFRGEVLGFADVDVVATGGQLKNVNTGEYIPLLDGRTLPIKFRIENGAIKPVVTMTDLGNWGASRINSSGQIAGQGMVASGEYHAVRWDPITGITDLGVLGHSELFAGNSGAFGINDAGQVVGYSSTTAGRQHAFRWDPATGMTDLGALNGDYSLARDINVAGQVAGDVINWGMHAFRWDQATGFTDLGVLAGSRSYGYGINAAGQVAGISDGPKPGVVGGLEHHAFVWAPATGMTDLDPGGGGSGAYDINDAGQVVGYGVVPGGGFRWDPATGMLALPTLGGTGGAAQGINSAGQVVGYSTTASGETHAFWWDPVIGMIDLGTLGGNYSAAGDINAAGQVVGGSTTASGETHAVLWTIVR